AGGDAGVRAIAGCGAAGGGASLSIIAVGAAGAAGWTSPPEISWWRVNIQALPPPIASSAPTTAYSHVRSRVGSTPAPVPTGWPPAERGRLYALWLPRCAFPWPWMGLLRLRLRPLALRISLRPSCHATP